MRTDSGEKFELICLWSRGWVTKGHGTEDGVPAGQGCAYWTEARFARFPGAGRWHELPLFDGGSGDRISRGRGEVSFEHRWLPDATELPKRPASL